MKKNIILFCLFFITTSLFSQNYKINKVNFEIEGKTKEQNILKNAPIDYDTIFHSEQELVKYIEKYKIQLSNLRIYDDINIDKKITDTIINEFNEEINLLELSINLTESFSFLAVPYFKYDSNSGAVFKVKAKDTNFLGTLNTMNFDLNFQIERNEETSTKNFILGANFSYDHPFNICNLKATFINDYSIDYTFGSGKLPEWDALIGLKLVVPIKSLDLNIQFKQYSIRDVTYLPYNDEIYFEEILNFSLPITILKTENFSNLVYTPNTNFTYYWDFDGIHNKNTSLFSPIVSLGHSLSLGQVNWEGNFRKGLSLSLSNSFTYNFIKKEVVPYLNFQLTSHWNFVDSDNWFLQRLGINAKFYSFVYIPLKNQKYYYGEQYGGFLRGIRDEQYFSSDITEFAGTKALSSFTAFTLCIDFPIKLFTTNFTKSFLRYFNFELQIAPFMDISLGYNRYTKRYFHPKDGFYTAGMEILVYPQKWSSFTVRGSLGIDMGRFLNIVDYSWRSNISLYEFSFGIGLHY